MELINFHAIIQTKYFFKSKKLLYIVTVSSIIVTRTRTTIIIIIIIIIVLLQHPVNLTNLRHMTYILSLSIDIFFRLPCSYHFF
jgi:hypothetical protein